MNFLDALKKISRTSEEVNTETMPSTEGKKLTPKAFSPKFDPTPEEYVQILRGKNFEDGGEQPVVEAVVDTLTESTETTPTQTESPQYRNAMMLYYANRTQNPLVSIHADIQDEEAQTETEEANYADECQLTMDFDTTQEVVTETTEQTPEITEDELIAKAMLDAGVYDNTTPESNLPSQAVINTVVTEDNENSATASARSNQEGVKIEIESATENGMSNTRVNKVRMELELTPEQTLSLFKSALATQKSIMTLNEASEYLRILPAELVNLALCGKIPSFRVEDQIRFTKPSIDQWIEAQSLAQMEAQSAA